jgi:hypothetical protein
VDIIALTQVLARIVRPILVSTLLVALVFGLSPAGVTRAATVTLVVDTTVDSNGAAYRACTGPATAPPAALGATAAGYTTPEAS